MKLLSLFALLFVLVFATVTLVNADDEYEVTFHDNITITTFDGFKLHGDGYTPKPKFAGQTFPIIIFPNSWGMPQIEYLGVCGRWAKQGYVTLEYETRGWWSSQGEIDVAGKLDQRDITSVIDTALSVFSEYINQTSPSLGFSGISYGGGLSLEAAGVDSRVKAIAAMSPWLNLTKSVLPYGSPALNSINLLVNSAKLLGRPSQELLQMAYDLQNYKNISALESFGNVRSPGEFIPEFNRRNIPVFYSTNMQDSIFPVDMNIEDFTKITAPKMFLGNQGGHAEAEALSLFDIPNNYIYTRALKWFDYWLKGNTSNGIMSEPMYQFESGNTIFSNNYQKFSSWPPPSNEISEKHYTFSPRGGSQFGGLVDSSSSNNNNMQQQQHHHDKKKPPQLFHSHQHHQHFDVRGAGAEDTIHYSSLPGIGTGGFLPSYLGPAGIPEDWELALSDRDTSLIYRTEPFSADTTICGTPKVNITVTPNDNNWQIYAFLYEVDFADIGRLISYGPYSRFRATNDAGNPHHIIDWNIRTLCTVMKKGHRLAIGFALHNVFFEQASNTTALTVDFSTVGASFTVPVLP